jgi:hypothetical protein
MADEKRRRGFLFWIAPTLLLLVLYVLSSGPAWRLYWNGYVSYPTIRTLYKPIFWIHKTSEPTGQWIDWYLNLWFPGSV